jgi:flagellar biogenesis protein FliO
MCSARPAQERLEVLDRRALGPRESLVLLRWGPDRLLIGVTAAGVTVLARQPGTAAATPGPAPEEGAAGDGDFAAALADVAERGRAEEASLRDLMTRSRHRLLRLGLASSHARRERG